MINKTNTYQLTFYVPTSRQRYQVVIQADDMLTANDLCISRFEVPGARISIEVCKPVPNDREVVNITGRYTNSRGQMSNGRITRDLESL